MLQVVLIVRQLVGGNMITITSTDAFRKTYDALHEDIDKMSEEIENKILKAAEEGLLTTSFSCKNYSKEVINIMEMILKMGGFNIMREEYFSLRENKNVPILRIKWEVKELK